MSDELFARAARALRESSDGESKAAARTRLRVLALAGVRRKRRRLVIAVVLPLAAAFAVSTAWAAASGRLAQWIDVLRRGDDRGQDIRASGSRPPALPGNAVSVLASAVPAEPDPSDLPLPPQASASLVGRADAPRPSSARPPVQRALAGGTDGAAGSEEELLFAQAQRQHFVAHDPQAALRGWDAYLAVYPHGRLAPEARYNRALTLVRLGRMDEARAALQPFASGPAGGYRQREAADLLQALDGGAP